MSDIKSVFLEAGKTLDAFIADERNMESIKQAGEILVSAFRNGNQVISCGNGGSMCDAMHFAEELSGRFRDDRKGLPAVAISDPGYLTCTANDFGYEKVFSRFVSAFGKKGDVLLAISTSGNSKNVIEAAAAAKETGMNVIALTGKDGGKLAGICDVEVRAPESKYADRAQEIHIKVIHALIGYVESVLFR